MTQGTPGAVAPIAPQEARSTAVALSYAEPGRIAAMRQFSATLVESGMVPQHVRTWQQAFALLVASDSLGIHPWTGLTKCYVVHGKVGCESTLLLAMIQRTGLLEEFELDGDDKVARCRMKRKGHSAIARQITIADAEKARWTKSWKKDDKGGGAWVQKDAWTGMPDLMLQYRVLARVARIAFADVVLGMYIADELDLPMRVEAGEVVMDAEAIPVPETVSAAVELREQEKQEKAQATEEQRKIVSSLFAEKGRDGKPYVPPAERKKWSQALAADGSTSLYAACIDSLQAIVTEAKDREGQGGLHESPPIQGGLL